MPSLFLVVVGPVLVILVVWVGATVYRLYNPERPRPFEDDPVLERAQSSADGHPVPVGVREIRADQRRSRRQSDAGMYRYARGRSKGVPEAWQRALWQRRN